MRHFRTIALAALLCAVATISAANTYTVTSTADSGAGTLRQAILDANANPGRRHDRLQHHGFRRPHHCPHLRPALHHATP